MITRISFVIFRKELLDTLRDRRTLFMMIGVPVLLYPAIILFSLQLAVMQQQHLERTVSRVVIDSAFMPLRTWLQDQEKVQLVESDSPRDDVLRGRADVVVQTPELDPDALDQGGTVQVELLYDAAHFESQDAAYRVEDILLEREAEVLKTRLSVAGVPAEYIEPLDISRENIAPPAKTTGNLIGLTLPILLVIMMALGAFYPAVDLTAGEKERGTFETLLSTPAPKLDIVVGKFLTVSMLAIITGLLNLVSIAATLALMFYQMNPMMGDGMAFELALPWTSAVIIVALLIPFGGMVSALMMSVAVFARSFKEAQNYVTPFFLVLMLPAMLAALPGAKLTVLTALAPVLNMVLLFRELMTGAASQGEVVLVLGATAAYAGLALAFAAWLFQREDVVLADQAAPLFARRKATGAPRLAPGAGEVLALYLLLAALLIYVGTVVQQWHLMGGLAVVQYGLILVPALLFLKWQRVDMRVALSLRLPSASALLGAAFMSLASVPLIIQINIHVQRIFPLPEGAEQLFKDLLATGDTRGGLLLLLFLLALTPAICEEVLFRGVILSGLRGRMHAAAVVVVVGVLFGAFHLVLGRMVPTALLGMVLTYVCLRSGSLYLAIAMHAFNNGFAVLLSLGHVPFATPARLAHLELAGFPWPVLVAAAGLFLAGAVLVRPAPGRRA